MPGREIFAAAERADHLAEAAVSELEQLATGGDLEAIAKGLTHWSGCKAPEVPPQTQLVLPKFWLMRQHDCRDAVAYVPLRTQLHG